MKFCINCGENLKEGSKFCPSCGEKTNLDKAVTKYKNVIGINDFEQINKTITIQNNQTNIVKKSCYAAGFFALLILVAFMDLDGLPIHPAIVMISIFFFIMSIIIGIMFRSREKKLQSLITGENLITTWTLTSDEQRNYVNYLFKYESGKNQILLFSIGSIAIVVFSVFILVIDEGKLAMFFVLLGLIAFLSLVAFGMPFYYRHKNLNNDGKILIGKKFAYVNGFFHNWDFPISGIRNVKIIKKPFYGLYIKYYYTDRTLTNTEELNIPAPKQFDLQNVIDKLKV